MVSRTCVASMCVPRLPKVQGLLLAMGLSVAPHEARMLVHGVGAVEGADDEAVQLTLVAWRLLYKNAVGA